MTDNTPTTKQEEGGLVTLVERLTGLLATLDLRPDEEWYAYIHKGGYDLCVESARRQPDHPNAGTDAIVGRFACGTYAIRALPIVAEAMNALPELLAALSAPATPPYNEDGLRKALEERLAAIQSAREADAEVMLKVQLIALAYFIEANSTVICQTMPN